MRYNPFTDYDKHGCIKLPFMLFLSLGYLLKGYVIWIVSLSYRQEPAALLNIFYPSRSDFYGALIIGIPALICVVIFSVRRVNMPSVFQWLWYKIRWLLMLSAIIQLAFSVWQGNISLHNLQHVASNYAVFLDFVLTSIIVLYILLNQRVIDVSLEFPIDTDSEKVSIS